MICNESFVGFMAIYTFWTAKGRFGRWWKGGIIFRFHVDFWESNIEVSTQEQNQNHIQICMISLGVKECFTFMFFWFMSSSEGSTKNFSPPDSIVPSYVSTGFPISVPSITYHHVTISTAPRFFTQTNPLGQDTATGQLQRQIWQ